MTTGVAQRRWIGLNTALVSGTAAILYLMGQPLWCACREWSLCSWDIWTSHNSQHLIDPYTLTHVLHGVLFCGALYCFRRWQNAAVRLTFGNILECGWEILENSPLVIERYRTGTMSLDYLGDSVTNSAGDILACLAGYLAAQKVGLRWSIVLLLASELLLVLWIRDCLLLNIVMLLWPIESIRVWQLGA